MTDISRASVEFMDAFCLSMDCDFATQLNDVRAIAVGVSGGADSLGLCFALSRYFSSRDDFMIYAITVDHRLRPEAAQEAEQVAGMLADLNNVEHVTLVWDYDKKPVSKIQEEARNARFSIARGYMHEKGIEHLFLGHHQDDQAETFLFRLAKGSGLDGLACMSAVQEREGVKICRPMLGISKDMIVAYCEDLGLDFINDPSNEDDRYARVRMRKIMELLSQEGLSAQRLSRTAMRMGRAREALENMAQKLHEKCLFCDNSNRIVYKFSELKINEKEVFLRVLVLAVGKLAKKKDYGVRMKKMERLFHSLYYEDVFEKQTLGGVVFEVDLKKDYLILTAER